MLFKVAGYADAAKQQADAGSVQPHSTAAAGQAGDCLVVALSHFLLCQDSIHAPPNSGSCE